MARRYFVRFADGSGRWFKSKDLQKLRRRPNGRGAFEIVGAQPSKSSPRCFIDGNGGGKWRVANRWSCPQLILDRRYWPICEPRRKEGSNGYPRRMNLAQEREEAARKLKSR